MLPGLYNAGGERNSHKCTIRSSVFSRSTCSYFKKGSKTMAAPAVRPENVKITIEGKDALPAVFCKNSQSKMGIVVLQEWWGLNQQIQDEAAEISKDGGFSTIVPDLYRGKLATDNEEANHLMGDLDWPGAIADIKACAKYLLSNGCAKVGVTGFCMGGALSMASAGLIPEVTAAAPFYGICGDGLCDPSKITKPLQCHFGANDAVAGFSCPESQEKLKKKLDEGKVPYEFYSYDAGHAFTNKTGPNFNEEACNTSLRRMYEFFRKQLS
ncbi:carboxymethylenebutenolidase-like [Haliotis cracherodii]|uniref:carboxymethylenebutenolidase-like n=1 Tax=Haliotis cracherodii TaxID=6455 RepID=UPI0039E98CCF